MERGGGATGWVSPAPDAYPTGHELIDNYIAPLAATPMTETIRTNEKFAANMMNRIPMKRWAEPSEIAGAFVFMASNASSYITGQVLPVDGGMVM